ncbi:MAG TPA: peptidyl-alpha-hydroxyglycine alpha-amidating lyase family protein [Candidatus Acidoferrales bacterium]|nr:peptidyl-alpha-hydroxyglycine alpha-amidating lyase family protein [Candidatus Acidoferrales bacterium]
MRRFSEAILTAAIVLIASPLFAQISVPEIAFDSAPNLLKMPDNIVLGEAVGVATNSKGHIFVYTRDGLLAYSVGTSRQFGRGAAARLYEFDEKGNFMREIGKGTYAQAFAHTVRIDPQDNIWMVDEGSNMIVKFSPEGKILMTLGRKPEDFSGVPGPVAENQSSGGVSGGAIERQLLLATRPGGAPPMTEQGGGGEGFNTGPFAMFNRETDVAWDAEGNIFVSDGYNNKRVVKFDKNGRFVKDFGSRGKGPGQFEDVHTIQVDHAGNVYVGDRSNKRLSVFDNDGNYKTGYINIGSPWAVCITPGQHQYLYSSNSTGTTDMENGGEIYKMELDGRILGKFGKGGTQMKEFMAVHELDCRTDNEVYAGEISNWRVQKLTLHPTAQQAGK